MGPATPSCTFSMAAGKIHDTAFGAGSATKTSTLAVHDAQPRSEVVGVYRNVITQAVVVVACVGENEIRAKPRTTSTEREAIDPQAEENVTVVDVVFNDAAAYTGPRTVSRLPMPKTTSKGASVWWLYLEAGAETTRSFPVAVSITSTTARWRDALDVESERDEIEKMGRSARMGVENCAVIPETTPFTAPWFSTVTTSAASIPPTVRASVVGEKPPDTSPSAEADSVVAAAGGAHANGR